MQIGGLGLITLAVFFMSLFVDIGLNAQHMTGQILEIDSWRRSKKTLFFIIIFTLIVETLATLCIYFSLLHQHYDHLRFLSFFMQFLRFAVQDLRSFRNHLPIFLHILRSY